MLRRWLSGLCLVCGCTLLLTGRGYAGFVGYVIRQEQRSPSTQQVLVFKDGHRLPLVQPTSPSPVISSTTQPVGPASAATAADAVELRLSPVRLCIPKINVDWPVVLSDVDHLPRFRAIGWLLGSAMPGSAGNLVLYGHWGGPAGTMMRLYELQPGDEFTVATEAQTFRYRVRTTYETTPDDIGVLAPTTMATATLITCSGPWDAQAQSNILRRVVVADYVRP